MDSGQFNCTLAYTQQLSNVPMLNLFANVYAGDAGQKAWLNLPINQTLQSQGNVAEIEARWELLKQAVANSTSPASSAVCSTNLSNQIAIKDLLDLYLVPASYTSSTCRVVSGAVVPSAGTTPPVTVTVTPGNGGQSTTLQVPQNNTLTSPIALPGQSVSATGASISTNAPIRMQMSDAELQQLLTSLGTSGSNGFAGTQSNAQLLSSVM